MVVKIKQLSNVLGKKIKYVEKLFEVKKNRM